MTKIRQMNKEMDDKIYIQPHYKLVSIKNEKGELETFKMLCKGFWRKKAKNG